MGRRGVALHNKSSIENNLITASSFTDMPFLMRVMHIIIVYEISIIFSINKKYFRYI